MRARDGTREQRHAPVLNRGARLSVARGLLPPRTRAAMPSPLCRRGLAVLLLGACAGAAARSGEQVCNIPETGTLQAGSAVSPTAQIRCGSPPARALVPPPRCATALGCAAPPARRGAAAEGGGLRQLPTHAPALRRVRQKPRLQVSPSAAPRRCVVLNRSAVCDGAWQACVHGVDR